MLMIKTGPVCRASVARHLLFDRSAFEPTDEDLKRDAFVIDDDESVAIETDDQMEVDEMPGRRVRKGKARARRDDDSEDEEDNDDMSHFIVESDENEEEKDARRAQNARRKLKGKSKATVIIDSDDEEDPQEVKEVLLGKKTKAQLEAEAMSRMPRFLPSTKMKFMMELIEKTFKQRPDEKVDRDLCMSYYTLISLVRSLLYRSGLLASSSSLTI